MSVLTDRHAAVIGINGYSNGISGLRSALTDAREVARALKSSHGYAKAHRLLDEEATLAGMTHLFETVLPETIEEKSSLVVYFAGHGVARGDGDEGPRGFLLPFDAHPAREETWLSMERARKALSQLKCCHLLVVLDCCFAGTFRWATSRSLVPVGRPLYESQYQRFLRGEAWQVLTSASHNEKAMDVAPGLHNHRDASGDGEGGQSASHSPFAAALLRGLAGKADSSRAGKKPDGVITATELYQYVYEELVPEAGSRQTPGLWPLKEENRGEFIFHAPGRKRKTRPDPVLNDDNNPWRGLKVYTAEQTHLFFGREKPVTEILERLRDESRVPFTAVVGASGSGKSSVVKAGVLPRLARDEDRVAWDIVEMPRLRNRPELQLRPELEKLAARHPHRHKLLVIDQFEELYTQCGDPETRKTFVDLLTGVPGLKVLVTLRSDFEPRLKEDPLLAELVEAGRYVVPPAGREDLRAIIEEPAQAKAIYFDPPELVGELADEVMAMPGALPLLSFSLAETYRRARLRRRGTGENDRALRREDYEATGGLVGSLHRRASELYDEAGDAQETVRRLFLRMVTREGGRMARRRVEKCELEFGDEQENKRVTRVIGAYVKARLLVESKHHLEPAHDTLVMAWEKVLDWLVKHGSQNLRRQLWRDVQAWDEQRTSPDGGRENFWQRQQRRKSAAAWLWPAEDSRLLRIEVTDLGRSRLWFVLLWDKLRGLEVSSSEERRTLLRELHRVQRAVRGLKSRRRWRRSLRLLSGSFGAAATELGGLVRRQGASSGELNRLEKAFVEASVAQRRYRQRFRVGFLGVVMMVLVALAFYGWQAAGEAKRQRRRAEGQIRVAVAGDLADRDPTLAAALMREIEQPEKVPLAFGRALELLDQPIALTVLPEWPELKDKHESPNGELRIQIAGTPQVLSSQGWLLEKLRIRGSVVRASFESSGERILTLSNRGDVLAWTLPDLMVISDRPVSTVAFSPEGDQVLTVADDGAAFIWPTEGSRADRFKLGSHPVAAAFGAKGNRLVTLRRDAAAFDLWSLEELGLQEGGGASAPREPTETIPVPHEPLNLVALGPRGKRLLWVDCDAVARVLSLETRESVAILEEPHPWIKKAFFSDAKGQRVTTVHDEGSIGSWDLRKRKKPFELDGGYDGAAVDAAFTSQGLRVLTVSGTTPPRIWSSRKEPLAELDRMVSDSIVEVDFSPRGDQLMILHESGKVSLWTSQGDFLGEMKRLAAAAAYHPAGDLAVLGDRTGTARTKAVSVSGVFEALRDATDVCVDPTIRQRSLGEPAAEAFQRWADCEDAAGRCVPVKRREEAGQTPQQADSDFRHCQDKLG